MWQFLNFFPLPQGQGSLRPTRSPRLRIGSIGLSSGGWPPPPPEPSVGPASGSEPPLSVGGGDSCVVEVIRHSEPTKPGLSRSSRKIEPVTCWAIPFHIPSNAF